jgi:hypothetical protein
VEDLFARVWENLGIRVHGPLTFRLIFQPCMAAFLAVRAGLEDARSGKPAFLWAVASDPSRRGELLRDAWKDIGKVFVLATALDVVFQLIQFRWIYPLETVLVAFLLAVVPYAVIRGPVSRLMRKKRHPAPPREASTVVGGLPPRR